MDESTVKQYMDTLHLLQREREEVENVILGFMVEIEQLNKEIEFLKKELEKDINVSSN